MKHYSEALARGPPKVNPEAHKLYSNRAACYTKLGAWDAGVKDADECIALKPDFAKGYVRKVPFAILSFAAYDVLQACSVLCNTCACFMQHLCKRISAILSCTTISSCEKRMFPESVDFFHTSWC